MKLLSLRTGTAIALILGATAAYAQQKPDDGKSAVPQAQPSEQGAPKTDAPGAAKKATEPQEKAGKGSAQTEPKEKSTKGSAQSEPKDKGTKNTVQGPSKEPPSKGSAQTGPKDKSTKGSAQTQPAAKDPKGTAQGKEPSSTSKSSESPKGTAPKDSSAGAATPDQNKSTAASGSRVQISEQQRATIHQTILKDRSVNRVKNVKFSINVGTRVPRDIRLVALPASVFTLVPEYRSYRYFVVNEQICIVDPNTYEIVEIINVPGQTAVREDRGASAQLVLSDDERMIILSEIDMREGSTMGLGAVSEGADVPRNVQVRLFPETIMQKVPKLQGYKFFTAENRVAIVDPQGSKVKLVIERRR